MIKPSFFRDWDRNVSVIVPFIEFKQLKNEALSVSDVTLSSCTAFTF